MKHAKSYYQQIKINGYKWTGYWDRFHHFTIKEGGGYYEIRCTDTDIEDGNLLQMIEYGLTK